MYIMSTTSLSDATNPLTTGATTGGRGKRNRSILRGTKKASRTASLSRALALSGGRRRKRHGGQSVWKNAENVLGSGDSQWDRVFGPGPNLPNGNEITGLQGQNTRIPASLPQNGNMSGGKRRTKKGGYWSQVISTALVPFGLWGAQNRFSKRRGVKHGGKTRKNRK